MPITCLNCEQIFEGNYCPNCGQKAITHRLNAAALVEETLHFFTHIHKGFLFTSWNYIVHPGVTAINYINGKRTIYQPPVSYFLIWTGLYILLHNTIIHYFHYSLAGEVVTHLDMTGQANVLLQKHFSLFLIPTVFISSLSVYYILARPLYNYIEILAISLFGGGTYFMITFFSDLILGYVFKVNILSAPVFIWQAILSSGYFLWLSFDMFKRVAIRHFWLRLISTSILVAFSGWIIMFYLPVAWLKLFGGQ